MMSYSNINTNNANNHTVLFNGLTLPSEKQTLSEIIDKAKDWAVNHGVGKRAENDSEFITYVPFLLLPSPFLRCEFEKATVLQPILNELLHNVAYDYKFLKGSLKDTIKADEFTRNLFEIYEIIQKEDVKQNISIGLFRTDYVMDVNSHSKIKQIETNTISCGFATLGQNTYGLHQFVLTELGYHEKLKNLPKNYALKETTIGLIKGWEMYNNKKSAILFVINVVSINICDIRFQEYEINKMNRDLKVIRRTLTQIANSAKLGPGKELLIDGFEIAVVYYRTGFKPEQYPSKREWNARLLMERSLAIKCPSIQYQLAGTKKIQQILAQPNVLEKFLKCPRAIKSLRETFTGLYTLDFDEYGEQTVQMALQNPEKYVLKSQRDGGGNNIFGENISDILLDIKDSINRAAWILMNRIYSPVIKGLLIQSDRLCIADFTSELGIYGVVIGNSNEIMHNKQAGYMLRSKFVEADESGVINIKNGGIDTPYLI